VAALQSALGNPALSAGLKLTVPRAWTYNVATSINVNIALLSTTLTYGGGRLTVSSTDTWTSITQTVYARARQRGAALQGGIGQPTLSAGSS